VSAAQAVLLAGIFAPPLLLLAVGHTYRHRSHPARGLFWGGVVGYGVGLVVTALAMLVPAVDWAGGSALRAAVVHAGPLAGGLLGIAAGWALARLRRENSHP
jgi:hypothetical protein